MEDVQFGDNKLFQRAVGYVVINMHVFLAVIVKFYSELLSTEVSYFTVFAQVNEKDSSMMMMFTMQNILHLTKLLVRF